MGFYINQDSKGNPLPASGKYDALIRDGGKPSDGREWSIDLVCVVDNGTFDAAAYAYSLSEMEFFKRENRRTLKWLTHPMAAKLALGDGSFY